MNIKFKEDYEENKKNAIPQVGDVWKHAHSINLYTRIYDDAREMFNLEFPIDYFYSLDLSDLRIVYTQKTCDSIEILSHTLLIEGVEK